MMVLYRSPEQTDLHTYISVEVSAKFTALNFIALHPHQPPQQPCFFFLFNASWQLNLKRGSPKVHFCQVILKLVKWFLTKRFWSVLYCYKALPTNSHFFLFDESWHLEKNLVEGHQRNNLFAKLNQVKLKSAQWFLTRRLSQFSI